jgi:hypothetical protein
VGKALRSKKKTATSSAKIYNHEGQLLVEAEAILVNVPQVKLDAAGLQELGWKVYGE